MSCSQDDLFIFGPGHVVRNALLLSVIDLYHTLV